MNVGIDLTPLIAGTSGGIVPFVEGVLAEFLAQSAGHRVSVFRGPRGVDLQAPPRDNVAVVALGTPPCDVALGREARRSGCAVLFRAFPGSHSLDFPAGRQVVLIPDLQHEFHPEFFSPALLCQRRASFDSALAEAGAVATLSQHALQCLRNHAATRCTDLFVMSPALAAEPMEPTLADLTEFERAVLPARDFFIYPANLWPHKNHRRVLQAFEQFVRTECRPVEFIFVGDPSGWAALGQEFAHLPIRHLGYVRRPFLQVLLQRAQALAFFSMFEGFGMPLLEAFHAGTPVICSNTTSLPEVGGDAVLSCDPTDVAAIGGCFRTILYDRALRERLIARGKIRLGEYSWEQSARRLWETCLRVAGRPVPQTAPVPSLPAAPPPEPAADRRPWTMRRIVRGAAKRVRHYLLLAEQRMRRATRLAANLRLPGGVRLHSCVTHALQPRLGLFFMYPARPLETPPHYRSEQPPGPAPTFAIVTPSFNQAGFLERTLRSVLDQNYAPLQYVVQDGGSWDQSAEILKRYRDRLTHAESRKDRGQAHAINLGFRHTTGEIMAYLNSDDLLLPGTLAYVARYFVQHPEVDAVYGHRVIIDEHDQEVGRWVLPPHEDRAIIWSDYVPQETLFWRRRIWEKAGAAMDESFQFALDWDLLIRFRRVGARFKRLPRFLGAFRVHHQQKTSFTIASVGARETERIMLELHGRPVTYEERLRRARGFLGKHVAWDRMYQWGLLSA